MSARSPLFPQGSRSGFTVVELLVSMSVLTLLLVMVTQMIGATQALTTSGSRHLDADTQARLVLDRMAVDFTQMVKRTDVDYYFQKNGSGSSGGGADDQFAFYSETSGYFPTGTDAVSRSNASLVGYRINSKRQLERLDKALVWNGVGSGTPRGMTFLPQLLTAAWPNIVGNGSGNNDADYHTIGEQIFRLEYCFLLRNATTTATFSDMPYVGATTPIPSPLPCNAMRDVAAVVVTLAVLDDTSRLLVSTADLDATAALLDDSKTQSSTINQNPGPYDATPPAQRWLGHVADRSLVRVGTGAGLPRAAAANVRVYERCFYLGNAQ